MRIPLLATLALPGLVAACATPEPKASGNASSTGASSTEASSTEVGVGQFGAGIHADDIDGG